LIQTNETRGVSGFPGLIHVPFLSDLLSGNTREEDSTDIIMVLTPHVVRSQEISEADLRPIYIGSQQSLSLGGPPPLIAAPPAEAPAPAPTPAPPGAATTTTPALPAIGQATPQGTITVPPGASPIPGTVVVPPGAQPAATPPVPSPAPGPPAATPDAATTPTPPAPAPQAANPPIISPGVGSAQVLITPPSTGLRVGQGPYNIPISVTGAQRLSTVTLSLVFDPAKLRVRSVQEGSFLRAGGANVTFSQQASGGRVDITISRGADVTGASGTGLLAAILFDAIAPGDVQLVVSGSATGPGGTAMGLQFRPVTVTVQP
jgi:hypothetical protein